MPVGPVSYQTTHGTESFGARERDVGLDAVTGRIDVEARILRAVPTRGDASLLEAEPADRGTCPVASSTPAGVAPSQLACPGPIGLTDEDLVRFPATGESVVSCQVIHGPGLRRIGGASRPATDGFSASWSVWMFSDGTGTLPPARPRPWPEKIHLPWLASPVLSKRLAKMLLAPNPAVVSSYQVAHGTVRPAAGEVDRRGLAVLRPGRS